jgi:hypothetical protein
MSKQKKSEERLAYEAAVALLEPCPQAVKSASGCKVSWRWYATMEEAQIAAQWAYHQAVWYDSMGYDFGYQCPGSVAKDGELFKVTFP